MGALSIRPNIRAGEGYENGISTWIG